MSKPTRLVRSTELQMITMENLVTRMKADDDPEEAIKELEEKTQRAQNSMSKALQAKAVQDGRTFLMHAAALGNKRWFLALVSKINATVSIVSIVMGVCSCCIPLETRLVRGHHSPIRELSAAP